MTATEQNLSDSQSSHSPDERQSFNFLQAAITIISGEVENAVRPQYTQASVSPSLSAYYPGQL